MKATRFLLLLAAPVTVLHATLPDTTSSPLFPASVFYAGKDAAAIFNRAVDSGAPAPIVPPFVLDPAPYAYTVEWDGLRQNGFFPAPGRAHLKTFVRDGQSGQVRTADTSFIIGTVGDSLVVTTNPSTFFWQPGSELSRITLQYRLFGNPSWLSAGIRGLDGGVLVNFFADSLHLPRPSEYAFAWDGTLRDRSGAQLISAGDTLEFFMTARSGLGDSVTARDSITFAVEAQNWREDTNLELRVEEGRDFRGQTYAKALPKFTLAADPRGRISDEVELKYGVQYQGKQKAQAYDAKRFNVWLQRTRDDFNVILVMKFQSRMKGYFGSGILGCSSASRYMESFAVTPMTMHKGVMFIDTILFKSPNDSYVFRCRSGDCATDLEHTVSFYLLPGSRSIPEIKTIDQYNQEKSGQMGSALYEVSDIQLFDNQVFQNGPVHIPNTVGWVPNTESLSGPYAAGTWFRKNRLAGGPGREATCDFLSDAGTGDRPAVDTGNGSIGNGIFDKGDRCADNSSYDPHDNIVEYSFDYAPGQNAFAYDNQSPVICAPPSNHVKLGFRLSFRVPDSYWNPPFGYNNLASRSMRWDPANAFLYSQSNGYFMKDGLDNHNGTSGDNAAQDANGYITPFEQQVFRWSSYEQTPFQNAQGMQPSFARSHPLSFGPDDHANPNSDTLRLGFNGGPEMGASSNFTLRLRESACSTSVALSDLLLGNLPSLLRTRLCPEGSVKRVVGEWNSAEHPWGNIQKISNLSMRHIFSSGSLGLGPYKYQIKNYFFELALKAKPSEYLTLAGAGDSIPWPPPSLLPAPSQACADIKCRREYYMGASNIRFGIGDGIFESGGISSLLQPGSAYVDPSGYYRTPLDSGFIHPHTLVGASETGQNVLVAPTRILLPVAGDDDVVFDDMEYFRKTDDNYSNTQGGFHFGQNVAIASATPVNVVPAGVAFSKITLPAGNAMRFIATATRPWAGIEDPRLTGRDLDGDGLNDEEGIGTDKDGDGLFSEDPPGVMLARHIFPTQALRRNYELFRDLYLPSVSSVPSDTGALFQQQPDGSVAFNPRISDLALDPMQVLSADGREHEDISAAFSLHGDPFSSPITVTRTPPHAKSRELLTLLTNAQGDFGISYIDAQGRLKNAALGKGGGILSPRAYFDVRQLQGKTSLFLTQSRPGDSVVYRKLDLQIGEPVDPIRVTDVTSLYGDASVHFEPGATSDTLFTTVRISNLTETGLAQTDNLAVVGPVIEVKPSMTFDITQPLPQVRIRLTKEQVAGQNLSALKIYKPDGENLVPLEHTLYAFFDGSNPVCTVNPDALCDIRLWNIMEIRAVTTAFSHFLVLDSARTRITDFQLFAEPAFSPDTLRNVHITGLAPGELRLFLDDDSLFADAGDLTPPLALATAHFVPDSVGLSGTIALPAEPGVYHLFAVSSEENGKIRRKRLELVQPLVFTYAGDAKLFVGGLSGENVRLRYVASQAVRLSIRFYRGGNYFGSLEVPGELPDGFNPAFPIAQEKFSGFSDGVYQSLIEVRGRGGEEISVPGPEWVVERTPPLASLTGNFRQTGTGGIFTVSATLEDEQSSAQGLLTVQIGDETLLQDFSIGSPGATLDVAIPGGTIAAHFREPMKARLVFRDAAGNTDSVFFQSTPLMTRNFRSFRIDGSLIDQDLHGFPVLLRFDNDSSVYDFLGSQDDGSDLFVTLPDGSVLPHHIEYFRPEERKAALWPIYPNLKARQSAFLTLHWGNKAQAEEARLRSVPVSAEYTGWWHFDREDVGRDASAFGNTASPVGSFESPGVAGEGVQVSAPGNGLRVPWSPSLQQQNEAFTFSGWFFQDPLFPTQGIWFRRETGDSSARWQASLDSGRIAMQVGSSSLDFRWQPQTGWNHLAFTFDQNQTFNGTVYADGHVLGSGLFTPGTSFKTDTGTFFFGNPPSASPDFLFTGRFDEIRTSGLARSPAWVRMEYEMLRAGSQAVTPVGDNIDLTSQLEILFRDNAADSLHYGKPQIVLVNKSQRFLSEPTLRLWLSRQESPSAEIAVDPYVSNPCGIRYRVTPHPDNADLVQIDVHFPAGFELAPGASTPLDGLQFGLHFKSPREKEWVKANDPSWAGVTSEFMPTDRIGVYDRFGNLIFGREPNPSDIPSPGAVPPPGTPRVAHSLQALYVFHEGIGTSSADVSEFGIPLDLTLVGDKVDWIPTGGVHFGIQSHNSVLENKTPNPKPFAAPLESGELALETWLETGSLTQKEARVMEYGKGDENNWAMSQTGKNLDFRLRTSSGLSMGLSTSNNPLSKTNQRYHVVMTYKPYNSTIQTGGMRIYVNGALVAANQEKGKLAGIGERAWEPGFNLNFGNSSNLNGDWQGKLFLASIYSRALSDSEINQNRLAGVRETGFPIRVHAGISCGDRFVPAAMVHGERDWMEDKTTAGMPIRMGNVHYQKGLGGQPQNDGGTASLVYDLETERLRLGLSRMPTRLTGFTGRQDGSGTVNTLIKTSRAIRMPSQQDWLNNTGSVVPLFASNGEANLPVDLELAGAHWLWMGQNTSHPSTSTQGVFGEFQAHFEDRPADSASQAYLAGLEYRYFEGEWSRLPDFHVMIPKLKGVVKGFDLSPRLRDDFFGFEFTGFIAIAKPGSYTFFTTSDDGSQLFINGVRVVNNDGMHSKREASGSIFLPAGLHAIRVIYFDHTRAEFLSVSYQGPGLPKGPIPPGVLFRPGPGAVVASDRVQDALAFYLFREEPGRMAYDLVPSGVPLDLDLVGEGAAWLEGGGMLFEGENHNTVLENRTPNAKLFEAATRSDELTVEAWIQTPNFGQSDTRILEYAHEAGTGALNFAVVQKGRNLEFLLRTTKNQKAALATTSHLLSSGITRYHVAFTYKPKNAENPDGGMRIYVNGVLRASNQESGALDAEGPNAWKGEYVFSVGNRAGALDKGWEGGIYMAAIYSRALKESEVAANFRSGIPTGVSTESFLLGMFSQDRLLPGDGQHGDLQWREDAATDGSPLAMAGVQFRTGLGGKPGFRGDFSWLLYDLESERRELGIPGVPLRFTGFGGKQDGAGKVSLAIKTSDSTARPHIAEWLANSGSVVSKWIVENAGNAPIDMDIQGSKWLWVGQNSEEPDSVGQGVLGQARIHFGPEPVPTFSPRLRYNYYAVTVDHLPDFETLSPSSSGLAESIDLSPSERNENFALEFKGFIKIATAGTYTFYTTSDDGSCLFLDGIKVVDNDGLHTMRERSGTITLSAGYHTIKVQYFQRSRNKGLEVQYQGPGNSKRPIPPEVLFHASEFEYGVKSRYFEGSWTNLPNFEALKPVKSDLRANFHISPRERNDHFGFTFEGHIYLPAAGKYTFFTASDDGSQLFINGKRVVDNNGTHSMQERSGSVTLSQGFHEIRVLYFESTGKEGLEVRYQGPGIPKILFPAEALLWKSSYLAGSLIALPY